MTMSTLTTATPKRIAVRTVSSLLVRFPIGIAVAMAHPATDSIRFSNGFNWLTDQLHTMGL